MTTMLHARWERHDANVRAEGVAQGLERGREQGMAQGHEQGMAQGREQGLADARAGLRRQASLKFGTSAAERLADGLAVLATREDLARVGDWIIECESGEDLLTRVRAVAMPDGRPR